VFCVCKKDVEKGRTDAGGPILNAADVDAKERELQRRIQDLDGEAKRAKTDAQEQRQKLTQLTHKMTSMGLEQEEQIMQMNTALKKVCLNFF
jgi:hypothetical protein